MTEIRAISVWTARTGRASVGLVILTAAAVSMLVATVLVGTAGPARADAAPPAVPVVLVSEDTATHTPHARNGEVRAFAEIGDLVYVGGTFTEVRQTASSPWLSRPYLFAYDRHTGAISTTFLPALDGAVNALEVTPDGNLVAGGGFRNVNGAARRNLVALNPATGATVASWVGRGDGGVVFDLDRHGNHLYAGGAFLWINGTFHSLLARLDATTGAVDPSFQIDASVPRASSMLVRTLAVAPDGSTIVIGGNFTDVNGHPRNQVAMIEVSGTPSVADWSTQRFVAPCYSGSFPYYVLDIDFSDDGEYFVIGTTGGRDTARFAYCDAVTRWETGARGSGLTATWANFTGTDTVTSVLAADGVVYAGGHFRWMNNANGNDAPGPGAVDRLGVAALDGGNGMPLWWNGWRSGSGNLPAGATNWGPQVPVLFRGTDGVYFGQDSDGMARRYHGRQGLFPLAGGRTVEPQNPPETTPGYLYLGTAAGELTRVPFDGTTLGTPVVTSQPELTSAGAIWPVADRVHWANGATDRIEFSMFTGGPATGGVVGPPWYTGYTDFFNASRLRGAFLLDGRLYYIRSGTGADGLYYRYFGTDLGALGAAEFSVPTQNLNWSGVRGLAYLSGGQIVFGHTNGSLRSVPFDPTAAGGVAVDGAEATVLATGQEGLTWSTPTLFYSDR